MTPASHGTSAPAGAPRRCASYRVARWLFPRLMALVFFTAFWSWDVQCDGLVGAEGIAPVETLVGNVRDAAGVRQWSGWETFRQFPTLFLWKYSDGLAHALCRGGMIASLLVLAGLFQGPLLLLSTLAYLSLVSAGGVFMHFQWDILLVESGFLSAWLAPWRWWAGFRRPRWPDPPRLAILTLHLLLWKLLFMSGYVKPASGDETWTQATALVIHQETQPLPGPLSWWAHHWPAWAHRGCCYFTFFAELILPFAIFLGRWGRLAAFAGTVLLMGGILLTGNYAYFNWLTLALAVPLLDDRLWPGFLRRWLQLDAVEPRRRSLWRSLPHAIPAAAWLFLSLAAVLLDTESRAGHDKRPAWAKAVGNGITTHLPAWVRTAHEEVAAFHFANSYGLFADMVTERYELVFEVSADGREWEELNFRYKPGEMTRRPPLVAPHQPRLDWQLWFVTGADELYFDHPAHAWVAGFCRGLLRHSKPVWSLVEPPAFGAEKTAFLRIRKYRYRFTDPATKQETGYWWRREFIGEWSPVLSLPPENPEA